MSVVAAHLKELLDHHGICYEEIPHITDFTALETSEHTHTPGRAFAKAVLVENGDELVMLVLPADHLVDLDLLRRELGRGTVRFAREQRIARVFRDCDRGAIPPFGNLYGLPVYCCKSLLEQDTITFNAGSHEMAIRMSAVDYRSLVRPKALDFSRHV